MPGRARRAGESDAGIPTEPPPLGHMEVPTRGCAPRAAGEDGKEGSPAPRSSQPPPPGIPGDASDTCQACCPRPRTALT